MIAQIKKYFQETQLEWQKVSKPDRKDVQSNTLVIIVACAVLGLFLWLVDGNTTYPRWASIQGVVLIVVLGIVVFLISRAVTHQWPIALLISIAPLAIVLIFQYVFKYPLEGFGMSLLRDLFIR
jgi:preprotein translocase SecE subunit